VQIAQRSYSIKKTGTYKRERRSKKGSEGTQDPVKTKRLPSSSTWGLAANTEGKPIQKVRKIIK
jgi:hypothetical protein